MRACVCTRAPTCVRVNFRKSVSRLGRRLVPSSGEKGFTMLCRCVHTCVFGSVCTHVYVHVFGYAQTCVCVWGVHVISVCLCAHVQACTCVWVCVHTRLLMLQCGVSGLWWCTLGCWVPGHRSHTCMRTPAPLVARFPPGLPLAPPCTPPSSNSPKQAAASLANPASCRPSPSGPRPTFASERQGGVAGVPFPQPRVLQSLVT